MALGFDIFEDFLDLSVVSDQERRARDAHHFSAVHVFFFDDVISLRDFFIDVAQQRERQIVLGFETGLRSRCVGRDSQDGGVFLLELPDRVTKLVSLFGSAGCVGAREKVKHHFLALELRQLE